MAGINSVTVLGNLGQDPELRYTQSGKPVLNMSVATSQQWGKEGEEKQEKTEWHRIIVWNKQAENCAKYLKKGSKVCVIGHLETRSWEADGQKKYTTEIIAREVHFLSGGGEGKGPNIPTPEDDRAPAGRNQQRNSPPQEQSAGLDDIPF